MNAWSGLNRRKFPRVNYPCLVTMRQGEDLKDALLTHTENVGTGGVCVIIKKAIKLYTPVDIELDLLDFEDHLCCQGRIVWSIQRKPDSPQKPLFYDIGIEFVDIDEEQKERIDKIVKKFEKKA